MCDIEELRGIKDRLQIMATSINDIIKSIERDSVTDTRKNFHDFLDLTGPVFNEDRTSYEIDVRDRVETLLERIMYW